MKVEIRDIQRMVDKYIATVVVTKGIWWRKYTAQHLIRGNTDGSQWCWYDTDKRCREWLELKLWVEWSKLIGNEGEKNARSIKH